VTLYFSFNVSYLISNYVVEIQMWEITEGVVVYLALHRVIFEQYEEINCNFYYFLVLLTTFSILIVLNKLNVPL
jgi:hypothetical protein